ncbi:MAG: hypothetical protein HWE27_18585 [Gammaproteobacteria bacterium]|nr:hypothetical protein [Gammaproteobacteria bacterium]
MMQKMVLRQGQLNLKTMLSPPQRPIIFNINNYQFEAKLEKKVVQINKINIEFAEKKKTSFLLSVAGD